MTRDLQKQYDFYNAYSNRWPKFVDQLTPPSLIAIRKEIDAYLAEHYPPNEHDIAISKFSESFGHSYPPIGHLVVPMGGHTNCTVGADFDGLSYGYLVHLNDFGDKEAAKFVEQTLNGNEALAAKFYQLERFKDAAMHVCSTVASDYEPDLKRLKNPIDIEKLSRDQQIVIDGWAADGIGEQAAKQRLRETTNAIRAMATKEFGITTRHH